MIPPILETPQVDYRNFNVCPHCEWYGEPATLSRLSESLPMVSRSDGKHFHLLLADRPLSYPVERNSGPTQRLSACFWYSVGAGGGPAKSTVVVLIGSKARNSGIFRTLERIADLLSS